MQLADFRPTRRNVVQFLEYLVGGALYFWSGYAVFAICYSGFGWDWLYAKLLADAIGWTLNYLVQRYWAFNNPALKGHEGVTAGKYTAITLFNFALDYLIIWGLKTIGISPYLGFFLSSGFFMVWNYVWYRFWVFVKPLHMAHFAQERSAPRDRTGRPGLNIVHSRTMEGLDRHWRSRGAPSLNKLRSRVNPSRRNQHKKGVEKA